MTAATAQLSPADRLALQRARERPARGVCGDDPRAHLAIVADAVAQLGVRTRRAPTSLTLGHADLSTVDR